MVCFGWFLLDISGLLRGILGLRGVSVNGLVDGCVGVCGSEMGFRLFVGEIGQPFGVVGEMALLGGKALCRQEKEHK